MSFYEEQRDKKLIGALKLISSRLNDVNRSINELKVAIAPIAEECEKQTSDIEDAVEAVDWTMYHSPFDRTTTVTCSACHWKHEYPKFLATIPLTYCPGCNRPFVRVNGQGLKI